MAPLIAFIAGLVFGVGLIVAGMANPAKVQGFLDLFGLWDPSLAFVMGGAIVVGAAAFAIAGRMKRSVLGLDLSLPPVKDIDVRLLAGSAAFGVGWGLAGFCPGPALVALGAGADKAVVFTVAMLAGMLAYELLSLRERASPARAGGITDDPGHYRQDA